MAETDQRAFELKVPFRFFLYNDGDDFMEFMEYMTKRTIGEKFTVKDWEPRGEEFGPYGTELNEYNDMPDNVGGYQTDEPTWLLRFTVFVEEDLRVYVARFK